MKNKFNILLLLLVGLCCFHTVVVGQVSPYQLSPKWMLGYYGGINFTSGSAVLTNVNPLRSEEMTSAICDSSRNIVVYSNNYDVVNSLNQKLTPLGGSTSSTNGPIIIPDPAAPQTQFYIFTGNAEVNGSAGGIGKQGMKAFRAVKSGSTVNITDLGALDQTTGTNVSEQMYVSSDDADGYWLIAHSATNNTYFSWHITAAGIGSRVTSTGTIASGFVSWQGSIKISKCQDRIAFVNNTSYEVYNWNKSTGKLGSLIRTGGGYTFLYGCEFSPSGNVLYFSSYIGNKLYQLNIGTGSVYTEGAWASGGTYLGSMQLGPDNKIYIATAYHDSRPAYLATVSNPETIGTGAGFNATGFALGASGATSPSVYLGVANIARINPNKPVIRNTSAVTCPNIYGFAYEFRTYFNQKIDVATSKWDFGDGSAFVNNDNTPSHTYPSKNVDTTYLVKLELTDVSCGYTWTDTMFVKVKACSQKVIPETPVCAGVTSASVKITQVKTNEVYRIVKPDGTVVDGPVTVIADADTLVMSVTQANLTAGIINDFAVEVKRTGATTFVKLDDADIEVKDKPKTNLQVYPTPQILCTDTAIVKLYKAENGAVYTVKVDNAAYASATQVNSNDTLIFTLPDLPAGTHNVTFDVTFSACVGTFPLDNSTSITIVPLADTTLEVSAISPVCLEPGTTATVKVHNPEKDLSYQVTYQGKPISNLGTTTSAGVTELNLTIPYDTLVKISNTPSTTPPLYVFNVTVTTLCKTKTLLDTAGIYLAVPAKNKLVAILQDPVCKGDTIRIQIAQADTAVTYTVFANTVLIETFKMTNPGDTVIKVLANTPFVAGSVNNIAINGEVKGCLSPVVVGTATVKVNNPVDTTVTYSIDSICVKHDAVIVFNNPQADVTYAAYLGNDPVSAGTGTSSIVLDKGYFNAVGKYGVLITGTTQACPVDTLHQRDTVKVVELDKTKLVSKDTIVVCANGDKAIVQIYDPQPAVTYSYGSSSVKAPSVATDSIQLAIPVSALADGLNDIRIDIANTICNDTLLAHAFILKINQVKGIIGDTSICRINKYEFEVSPLVPGAKSYTWWTKHNAVVSNPVKLGKADSARVTFDFAAVVQDTDVVYVSVNGDSICTFPPAAMKVRMFDPLSGLILKDDTICADAYGPDSVRYTVAAPVSNAPKYKWVKKDGSDGLIIKYPLTEAGVPDSTGGISIAFPPVTRTVDSIGIDLEIIPYSVCLKDYDASNSVIKHITILPTPDVNAGRDIDTVNATFPQIILNGATTANGRPSSSLNPTIGKPVYQYSWIPKETGSYIESPDKIQTLLVSQSAEQNTYVLSVWNRGRCMVSDEVSIKIQLTIDPSNAFTPNGDGKNDVWEIRNLEYFPNNTLVIYNQWGSKVYEASPYHNNWAGTHNGEDLPIGTYYYVLDLHKANIAPMAGSITIVK